LKTIKTAYLQEELQERLRKKNIDGESELDLALATATNDELMKELNKRFNAYIFIMEEEDKDVLRNNIVYMGGFAHILGLIKYAKLRVEEMLFNDS
jgi:hypothetical protein